MTAPLFLLLGIVVACDAKAAPASATQRAITTDPMRVVHSGKKVGITLAPALQRTLRRHFPGFSIPSCEDYDPALVHGLQEAYQAEGRSAPYVPFACVGDFDGNALPDIALLLKNRHGECLLVALHQTSRGTFRSYRLDHWKQRDASSDSGKMELYLERTPSGEVRYIAGHGESASMQLNHDGITEGLAEASTKLYYFRRGRYWSVWTND
jgi:hypothetical protein